MTLILLPILLGIPALGALILGFLPARTGAAWMNVAFSAATLAVAGVFVSGPLPPPTLFVLVDDLNRLMIALIAFVGFTTSLFSVGYLQREIDSGHLKGFPARLYHPLFQIFVGMMLLAVVSNNLGVLWVAMEGGTLATVFLVASAQTDQAIRAAWKYLMLCSVGIALALLGTTLIYFAAQPVLGEGLNAMAWSGLQEVAADLNPALMGMAFVFLLVGYGTKIGLVPLHAWLPDAHGEGPAPVSAMLSGLFLGVGLVALLRIKTLMGPLVSPLIPGPAMMALGLVSLAFSGFMLYRRRYYKFGLAYSSIEHMGIATFALGLGGPLAAFAGLLHLLAHGLIKASLFSIGGVVVQIKGVQDMKALRDLTTTHPMVGWALVAGFLALMGLPPFGLFLSELLLLVAVVTVQPWLAVVLALGILVATGALLLFLQRMAFGKEPGLPGLDAGAAIELPAVGKPVEWSKASLCVFLMIPVGLNLAAAVALGLGLLGPVGDWLVRAAKVVGS